MQFRASIIAIALCFVACALSVDAQDPAQGWMAYAVGQVPSGTERITKMTMTWTVSNDPPNTGAFFSPWFGMDPADNLNLIQPVNPWEGGWNMYTEYFEWDNGYNSNSNSYGVKAGQNLTGVLQYDANTDSYLLSQTIVETGQTSSQTVRCENGKKFVIPYVVYEKTWPCSSYPSDEKVTFRNIQVECDGSDCTNQIKWEAKVEDANCDMTAHINGDGTISITWNTSGSSKYDKLSAGELFDLNHHGWARALNLKRPE